MDQKGLIDKLYLFMKIKNINDITLFRYLFCLDKENCHKAFLIGVIISVVQLILTERMR